MNNKRVILAVALSLVVLVVWSLLFSPKPPQKQSQPQEKQAETPAGEIRPELEQAPEQPAAPTLFEAAEGQKVTVDTPLYRAVFNSQGGVLLKFELKRYKQSIAKDSPPVDLIAGNSPSKGPMGLLLNGRATWRTGEWAAPGKNLELQDGETGTLKFTGKADGVQITRTLSFHADGYLIEEKTRLLNTTESPLPGRLGYTLAAANLSAEDDRYNLTRISYLNAEGVDDEDDKDDLAKGILRQKELQWGAVQSNYFFTALAPETGDLALKAKYEDNVYRVAVEKQGQELGPGVEKAVDCAYYLGPVLEERLKETPNKLSEAVTYGWFDVISKPLLKGLNFFYRYTGHNYGVAIILLTVSIKIVFWPLSQKSYKSMSKMKKIQPLMAKIREEHKGDRQKMNQEMMRLYKTYKVNPAGGCLPIALQIPVFFGLYQALLGAIELRHAPFITHLPFTDMIWLADLSAKDPYYVTPLIMGASMFLQQKMTPSPGDPTQAKIMLFMPIIFTFLFLNFPSGLVVYWLVNNILSIAQQWLMIRKA